MNYDAVYQAPNGHAKVFEAVGGGYIIDVTISVVPWRFIRHSVRGDLDDAKRKADRLDKQRVRQLRLLDLREQLKL